MTNISTPPLVSGAKPGIGHIRDFMRDRVALFRRGFEEHGSVFYIKLASQNMAVAIGTEHQRTFFMETDKALSIQKPYKFLKPMFGEVLFLAPHDVYLEQRPVVLEAFRREKMAHYLVIMQEEVHKWMDALPDSGEMNLVEETTKLVQEVAGNCFLGSEAHQQIGREFWELYVDLAKSMDQILPPDLPLPKFIRRDKAKARMIEILQPIIAERRQNPQKYDDYLQDLVNKKYKDGREVEEELIVNLLLGLMFAGHETTAGQAAWTIILLMQNPDYLALVQEEIDALVPADQQMDHRTLAKLNHISWAVRETERMRPSADLLTRTVEEDIEIGDYLIPEGWLLTVTQNLGHNLPSLFERPEQYDPLRYAPDRAEDKQDRFALFGFGGGTHKCTGMNFANTEMMVITALLFQEFEVRLITEDPWIQTGIGANRPADTIVRFRRKKVVKEEPLVVMEAAD